MSKELYTPPIIKKQIVGIMNKMGNIQSRLYREDIDGVPVEKLTKNFGSPLFVFSEKTLRRKYSDLHRIFSTMYPKVQFSWSYKTNYLGAICLTLHDEGEIAEVVSDFEYDKARSLGVEGKNIIFNGPYKGAAALRKAFIEDAIVNLDNFDEIYLAEKIARELKKKIKVGIRINMDTGIKPQWDKFGFNLESGIAHEAVSRLAKSNFLKPVGLHSHIGTFILEPKAYASETEKMVTFMHDIKAQHKIEIEYIDIGGGFPSKNRLKGIYLPPEVVIPGLDKYAEAICDTLNRLIKTDHYPRLYLESGRAIVDEAGYLISTVVAQKNLPDNTKSYIIDAGINLMFTSTWYNYYIQPSKLLEGIPEPGRIYGPLCMNIDVVADNVYLPPLPIGSQLVISPMGAYNVTQWMQFISYRPAVVMIMKDGTPELIRRKEKLEDITNCELIPKSLKK